MKRVLATLFAAITSLLLGVVGIVFAAIEIRLLVSGELMYYADPTHAYFSTIVKTLIAFLAIAAAIMPWIANALRHKDQLFLPSSALIIGLDVISVFHNIFGISGSSTGMIVAAETAIFIGLPLLHTLAIMLFLMSSKNK